MGRPYTIDGEQTVTTPADSILGLTSTTAIRPEIFYFSLGCEGTPADNTLVWYAGRYTAAGTATAVTPQALDPGEPAATASAGENHTVEPTYTADAIMFRVALNQRSVFQWYGDRCPIKLPATGSNGAGFYNSHASATPLVSIVAHYRE